MNTREKTFLNAHLDEHPTDWEARLALADILEEEGADEEARMQRWMAEHKKSPELGENVGPLWERGLWYAFDGSGCPEEHYAFGLMLSWLGPFGQRADRLPRRADVEAVVLESLAHKRFAAPEYAPFDQSPKQAGYDGG